MESLSAFATRTASTFSDDSEHFKAYVSHLEKELAQLHEAISPIGLVQVDVQSGRFISANDTFCALVGYSEGELNQRPFADLLHPGHVEPEMLARAGTPVFQDKRFVASGGRLVWASVATTLLREPSGRLVATSVIKDITPRKEALAQAAVANRFLSAVLEASTQGIISVDEAGKITLVNVGAEQLFGYSRDELISLHFDVLVPENFRQAHVGHQRDYFRERRNRPWGKVRN